VVKQFLCLYLYELRGVREKTQREGCSTRARVPARPKVCWAVVLGFCLATDREWWNWAGMGLAGENRPWREGAGRGREQKGCFGPETEEGDFSK